jgi:uncharacterized protein (TIGR02391 family)
VATFTQVIPSVDDLLAMHVEQLAEYVLKLAAEHRQNGMIHQQAMQALVQPVYALGAQGYPAQRQQDALGAIAEAWSWLLSNGFLVPDPGPNGSNGFVRLSRQGARILEQNGFARFLQDMQFPKTLLHPKIADQVWGDLIRGELDTAVFKAFKSVEVAVRVAGAYPDTEIGVALMRRAFHPEGGPLTDMTKPPGERDALMALFAGAIGSYKNPHSHRTVAITEPQEAQEQVILASHLLRIVDSRAPVA